VLLLAAAVLAGPRILLLLPVWLLGVWLQRRMPALDRRTASWLFVATLAAGLAFFWVDAGARIREAMRAVWPGMIAFTRGSNQFGGDVVLGVIVALHFLAARSLGMRVLLKCEKAIRYLAGFTFSMYVFHLPLAVLVWNVLGVHAALPFFGLLLLGVVGLGELTERRTAWYRSQLAPLFAGAFDAPRVERPAAPLGESPEGHAGP
jgi:hypothetical protein